MQRGSEELQAGSQVSLVQSDGVLRRRSVVIEKRKERYPKTREYAKIPCPGLDISETPTYKLEQLVLLNLNNNHITREWKIKAAHELAARFMEGDTSLSKHQAPCDHVKAYEYAQVEINTLSIEELEFNFFNAGSSCLPDEPDILPWQDFYSVSKKIQHAFPNKKRPKIATFTLNLSSIKQFIAEKNDALKKEKALDPNGIILAWEKQLAAARLAEHYRKLKKETRDVRFALAAKFYKHAVIFFAYHEPPSNRITSILLKIISPKFNAVRLFIIRLNKLLTQINTPLLSSPFLKWLATLAGLYFLAELILDLRVLINAWVYNAAGEFDPSWSRLALAFWEDNRPSRMANALVWFSLNLICLLLTLYITTILAPILIGIITIAGCVFDVMTEITIGLYSLMAINELRIPIDEELEKLSDIDVNKKFTNQEEQLNPAGIAEQKQKIAQKLALLEVKDQLIKKRVALELNRAYTVFLMVALVIAAAFIFFPPTALPFIPIVAACAAFMIGSVFGGLGKYLFWNAPEYFQNGKELVLKSCRSLKEFLFGKVKAPLKGHSTDDWHLNTKQIQENINYSSTLLDSPTQSPYNSPEQPVKRQNQINYLLHRSPSGTLFLHEATPDQPAKFLPPAPLDEPKNLKPM